MAKVVSRTASSPKFRILFSDRPDGARMQGGDRGEGQSPRPSAGGPQGAARAQNFRANARFDFDGKFKGNQTAARARGSKEEQAPGGRSFVPRVAMPEDREGPTQSFFPGRRVFETADVSQNDRAQRPLFVRLEIPESDQSPAEVIPDGPCVNRPSARERRGICFPHRQTAARRVLPGVVKSPGPFGAGPVGQRPASLCGFRDTFFPPGPRRRHRKIVAKFKVGGT